MPVENLPSLAALQRKAIKLLEGKQPALAADWPARKTVADCKVAVSEGDDRAVIHPSRPADWTNQIGLECAFAVSLEQEGCDL